jgi:CBS domain-containing protein
MKDVKNSLRGRSVPATVVDVMTPLSDLLYVTADEDVAGAFEQLQRLEMRHIPVVFDNRLVGLLYRKDVKRMLQVQA